MKLSRIQLIIALCLICIGISLRLLPHPANFAPVTAIALFGGSVLPRKLAIWVPLLAMIVSDAIIGFYSIMFVTWGCFALIALASSVWLKKPTLIRGAVVTASSSVFFYVTTNFAVWLTSGMYAHTWAGLVNCYVMAIPFFRNTLLSDAIYTAALFGLYAFAVHRAAALLKTLKQTAI